MYSFDGMNVNKNAFQKVQPFNNSCAYEKEVPDSVAGIEVDFAAIYMENVLQYIPQQHQPTKLIKL